MDDDGQIKDAHSISAGLDYPGIGPEHAWLHDMKRVQFLSATDDEAREGLAAAAASSKALSPRSNPRMRSPRSWRSRRKSRRIT